MNASMNFRYGKQRKLRYTFKVEAEFFKIRRPSPEPRIHICEAYGIWEESIAKTQLELRIHEATLIKQEEEEEKNKLH